MVFTPCTSHRSVAELIRHTVCSLILRSNKVEEKPNNCCVGVAHFTENESLEQFETGTEYLAVSEALSRCPKHCIVTDLLTILSDMDKNSWENQRHIELTQSQLPQP